MSEFTHPPIDLSESSPSSPEELFAEEAYQLLVSYGVEQIEPFGGLKVSYQITERVDVKTTDEQEAALRLRAVPCYSPQQERAEELVPNVQSDFDGLTPTYDYLVLELEYGTLDPDDPELTGGNIIDEDYDWRSYICIVIDTDDPRKVDVLDGDTGAVLGQADVGLAHQILRQMHTELRGMTYTDDAPNSKLAPLYWEPRPVQRIGERVMEYFVPAEDDPNLRCVDCEDGFPNCDHEPFRLQ